MYALDFEYDGTCLSDFGFIICRFDASSGSTMVDAGSKITFEKVPRQNGTQHSLVSAKYNECIQTSFDICKNPDLFDPDDREINNDEYRDLVRWLNRKGFYKLHIYDEDDKRKEPCFYNASFNINKITIAEKLFGLQLTVETDKPFGYGIEKKITLDFSDSSGTKTFYDMSDDTGYIYPDMTIICKENGNLTIHNDFANCTTFIKNCSVGEVITIKGNDHIISSTYSDHDICKDFNFGYFKIGNTVNNRKNIITVSLRCVIVMKYLPVIKDTP